MRKRDATGLRRLRPARMQAWVWAVLVAAVVAVTALSSCSTKKNTAATRKYQEFITRYNIHYNGDTHYKETLSEMESTYEDDYSLPLVIHPAAARANEKAPQPTGNFDRSIEKAQKAIQLRSIKKKPKKQAGKSGDAKYKAWMRREEYNPFLHNSWMMMGRSQYMNGDFLGSASTFFYISKHFSWLPATVVEAKLWQARCYCALDWLFEAENILTRVKPDQLTSKPIRSLYYSTYADLLVKEKEYEKAIPMLTEAVRLATKHQKPRLNFLLGQVYTLAGDKEQAYKAFKKAAGSSSSSYRAQFNARIKQSEVFTGTDIMPEVKALKRMARYDRNKEYLDQVYYAIGNLYLSRGDTTNAIANYELAVEKSTRGAIDKAIAQITLGALYYDRHLYAKAQPCYSEAVPLLPESWPDLAKLRRRSDVLDELALYSQNVELNDSLLRLSEMTPEQQRAVVDKIIEELKKKEKEEADAAAREEFLANRDAMGQGLQSNTAPQTFTMNNGDDSWYFYNTATKNAGRTQFQRKWGNRKLEDNWRRRNKASFDFNDFGGEKADGEEEGEEEQTEETEAEEKEKADAEKENDPHFPEYYLKQIPKTDAERQTANDIIQEGLYNMGVILKDKMEDFPAAESEFNRLLTRYPDNIYRLDAYYNLYLMYVRQGDTARAEHYRNLILSNFPESSYGMAMRDPDYIGNLRRMMDEENRLYDEAFEAYSTNDNSRLHRIYQRVRTDFPLTSLMPKFMFLEALAQVTDHNTEVFKATLMELLERYPDTDITPYASAYLKGLAQGRELQTQGGNMRGMVWDIRLGNDSIAADAEGELEFDLDPQTQQYLVLLYPTDEVSANGLLYEVARHNFSSFVVKDFDLEQMNFGRLGLLIIKGFDNVEEINHYRKVMAASPTLKLPPQVRPVVISAANFDKLLQNGRSFDDYFRYMRDKTYRDTEEAVLPPEVFSPSEGLDPEETAEETGPLYETEETVTVTVTPEDEGETEAETPETEAKEPAETRPDTKPEAKPEAKPTKPADKPSAKPAAKPGTKPAQKPETKPAQKPETKPETKPAPKPAPKPQLPEYEPGSEGDDPLLD